jgi:CRP/FNR family transcriptional regulator, dissimilatory nitrate respiration regulator
MLQEIFFYFKFTQKTGIMLANLDRCSLFKGLRSNEIEQVMSNAGYQVRKYQKEDLVVGTESDVNFLLILSIGSVRGEMMGESGKLIKIEDIDAPNLLAPAFLFGHQNKFPVTIIANKVSEILIVQKGDFIKMLQSDPLVLTNFLDIISSRAQFLSSKIKFLSFQTIKGKLAHFYLLVSKKTGSDTFISPKSQNELSEMFGVARPSLSRAIREMDKEGVISVDGKKIQIQDKDALVSLMK